MEDMDHCRLDAVLSVDSFVQSRLTPLTVAIEMQRT